MLTIAFLPPPFTTNRRHEGNASIEPSVHHYDERDHDDDEDHDDAYGDDEEDELLPPQPTIHRGYVSESIAMVQHRQHLTSTQQEGHVTDGEDEQDYGRDDTMYTALDENSDDEESSPLYSQETLNNPFQYVPDPEQDYLLMQERERQRIASRDKLGIVG